MLFILYFYRTYYMIFQKNKKINWKGEKQIMKKSQKTLVTKIDINNDAEIMAFLDSGVARLHKIPNTVGGQKESNKCFPRGIGVVLQNATFPQTTLENVRFS